MWFSSRDMNLILSTKEAKLKETFMDHRVLIVTCLVLSVIRIYLEVIGFDFAKLPVTKHLPKANQVKFHKLGFYMSLGYFVLFAPEFLLG